MEIGANRLGEMLLEAGLIDRFQLESALSLQRNLGGRIGSALVKLGYLPEETIMEFIESQARFSRVALDELEIPPELMKLLSADRMLDLMVVPLELRKNKGEKILRMAMTDPTNSRLIDDLQFATGCKILPVVASEAEIQEAINNNLPATPPAREEQPVAEEVDHQLVDFSQTPGEDPRVDRLLEVLQKKGILSVIDVERIKFD